MEGIPRSAQNDRQWKGFLAPLRMTDVGMTDNGEQMMSKKQKTDSSLLA